MDIDEEEMNIIRSARSQMIIDTIERAIEKMMFVEANIGKKLSKDDIFQIKREAKTAITELKVAIQILTGQLDF
ncbi:MAG TPA: hypothetical protein EYP29_05525 [Thermoplasmata archaeon]|nr:hypothetical protein [Thermoplasmata archaeon]